MYFRRSIFAFFVSICATAAMAQQTKVDPVQTAKQEIKQTLGTIPVMFRNFPDEALPGAWAEFKNLQLNPNTAISSKGKELIGAAVAAQIPCHYCSYFHRKAAMVLDGASDREIKEAIALSSLERNWAAVINGANIERQQFLNDLDQVFSKGTLRKAQSSTDSSVSGTTTSPKGTGASSAAPTKISSEVMKTPEMAYQDIDKTFGFVPQFFKKIPRDAIAGLWTQSKVLEFSATTAITPKTKALISYAVAAQIPCQLCMDFESRNAKQFGATDQELQEASAIAGITRQWSTVMNGNLIDENSFRKETDQMLNFVKSNQASAAKPKPAGSNGTM